MRFPENIFEKVTVGGESYFRDKKTRETFDEQGNKTVIPPSNTKADEEQKTGAVAPVSPVAPAPVSPGTSATPVASRDMSPPKESAPAPKPKFSSSRAMEFSDAAGYVYLIDPSTKVVKIAKAPDSNKKAEGALLTATGKNQKAYEAIWAKYGSKVEQLASRSPLDIEVGDDVEEEIGEAPPDRFTSARPNGGGPNAEAGRNARKSLLQTQFS